MPMQRSRYPVNWPAVAAWLKEQADWRCQECDLQCRRPGEPLVLGQRLLTVAHVYPDSHAPDAEIVCIQVLCQACHLRFDRGHAARRTRLHYRRYHMALPTDWARQSQSDLTLDDLAEMGAAWPSLDELFAEALP